MSLHALLRRWEIFSHFSDQQLDELAEHASFQRVPAGTAMVKEGDATRDAYLIEAGEVSIQRRTSYGLFRLATLTPGEIFGETSFVDGLPRSSDAVAVVDTDVVTLSHGPLAALSERDQRFALALYWSFWKSLSKKLRQTNEKLTRFFGSGAASPSLRTSPAVPGTGEFHVDVASKRKLFQEQRLSSLEINFLASLSKEKKLPPNQVIFRDGEEAHEMYVVLEGRVMISKFIPGAGEEALAFLERGDYFGEMALIDNQPRSAEAKAHEEGAVVLAIKREVLQGILDINKLSSLRLLNILSSLVARRLRELDDKVVGWFILAGGGGAADRPGAARR